MLPATGSTITKAISEGYARNSLSTDDTSL